MIVCRISLRHPSPSSVSPTLFCLWRSAAGWNLVVWLIKKHCGCWLADKGLWDTSVWLSSDRHLHCVPRRRSSCGTRVTQITRLHQRPHSNLWHIQQRNHRRENMKNEARVSEALMYYVQKLRIRYWIHYSSDSQSNRGHWPWFDGMYSKIRKSGCAMEVDRVREPRKQSVREVWQIAKTGNECVLCFILLWGGAMLDLIW